MLEHRHLLWHLTEPEKLGIELRVLPQRIYRGAAGNVRRYFPLNLPVALGTERAVFVYVERLA